MTAGPRMPCGHPGIERRLKDLPRKIQKKRKYDHVKFGQVENGRADVLKVPDCFGGQGLALHLKARAACLRRLTAHCLDFFR